MRTPEIVAGDPELHCWCRVCQMPSRVRIPLHLDAVSTMPAAVLEICPGCGTGHDRPSVTAMPLPRERISPLVAAAHTVNRWFQRRRGRPALGCAHRDCPWPGTYRHQHEMLGDEGRWTYHFCTRRHRAAWAADHLIRLP
jgi:hypothetical protein